MRQGWSWVGASLVVTGCGAFSALDPTEDDPAPSPGASSSSASSASSGGDGGTSGSSASSSGSSASSSSASSASSSSSGGLRHRAVFVTRQTYPGDFAIGKDPVAEADRLCDVAAGAPAGSYIAWLSFTGEPVQTRLPDDVRWHLGNPGGPVVFASRADFVAGAAPTVAIDADSSNVRVVDDGGPTLAWTGSTANGLPSGQDCAKWVSGAPQGGRAGIVGDTTGKWTNAQTVTCAQSLHLYCFGR